MKYKKCATCNKYRYNCKCVKEPTVFPRACPCELSKCQETWKEYTKDEKEDDDTDYIVYHCKCHDISWGKTSFHCEGCDEWVCQDCAHYLDIILDGECSESDNDTTYCKPCVTKRLTELQLKYQGKLNKLQTELPKFIQ